MGVVIEIADGHRCLGHFRALDGFHHQVDEGEVSIVPGPDGAATMAPGGTLLGGSSRVTRPESVCLQVRAPQVLMAQVVQRGYSSVGEVNTSVCDVDAHLVNRSPGALPCR